MGQFLYGKRAVPLELPDRTLMHVQAVVSIKLRRHESFMLNLTLTSGAVGWQSYWLHPSIPIQFLYGTRAEIRFNRTWVERLLKSANQSDGLWITREPQAEPAESAPLTG